MLTAVIVIDLTNRLVKYSHNYKRFTIYRAIYFFSVSNIFAIKLKDHSLKVWMQIVSLNFSFYFE